MINKLKCDNCKKELTRQHCFVGNTEIVLCQKCYYDISQRARRRIYKCDRCLKQFPEKFVITRQEGVFLEKELIYKIIKDGKEEIYISPAGFQDIYGLCEKCYKYIHKKQYNLTKLRYMRYKDYQHKFKDWHTCSKCAAKQGLYLQGDGAITVSMGKCPDCGEEKVTLIPLRDFDPSWDD